MMAYLRLMRFHKPVGIYLLLWPTLWALWLAVPGQPSFKIITIFVLGVIVMRAAGCVVNDIADRRIDKHVRRTAGRPITTGEVSVRSALVLLFVLLLIALILVLQLNWRSIQLSFIALFFAVLYPYTKRFTSWPQLFLGLAFAMAIPMAYVAQSCPISISTVLLFLIAVLWPLMYDTEYALADLEDDIKIGVKSTAIAWGRFCLSGIAFLQVVIVFLFVLLGVLSQLNWLYFLSLVISVGFFIYQISLLKQNDPQKAFAAFVNNQWVGLIIFLGILLGK